MVKYTREWVAHMTGYSLGITLTYPLKLIGTKVGDVIKVTVNDNNTITLEKVKK
jgi:hypothetical protein